MSDCENINRLRSTADTAKLHCRLLFDILLEKGIRDIVLSPGSRNAPLLTAVACRDFRRHIVSDERRAAFMALGLAMASGRPTAVVCTSGTALLNYAPAVAEAMYQGIPLIVISADRPIEWIDQDDSQTIRQPGILSNIVKGSYDLPVENPSDPNIEWFVNRTVNEACNLALSDIKGPVHINVRINTPLSKTIEYIPSKPRIIESIGNLDLPAREYERLAAETSGRRVMVVVGFAAPTASLNRAIAKFSALPNVVLMTETLSNLHIKGNPYSVDTALSYLENLGDKELEKRLAPDIVISVGGSLVSRKLKEFIRRNQPAQHWTLGDTIPSADCFKSLTHHIDVKPDKFFKGINRYAARMNLKKASEFASDWCGLRDAAQKSHRLYLKKYSGWSEMTAFRRILESVPSEWNLFLSNGTTVRYAQLFTDRIPHASYGCRGVSGIDGTTATALGCAMAYPSTTLLITGDMSFAYDLGVMGVSEVPERFKVIVISNEGGGIFRFIPSTRDIPLREELFCADPKIPIKTLAEAFGWKYYSASGCEEMDKALPSFMNCRAKALLEIKVDPQKSADILIGYMERNKRK